MKVIKAQIIGDYLYLWVKYPRGLVKRITRKIR